MMTTELHGQRILLRAWRANDLTPCAAMHADPEVMQYFPATLNQDESKQLSTRIRQHFDEHGYGLWVLEIPGKKQFAGFVGLQHVSFHAHFTPAVEISWRLVCSA